MASLLSTRRDVVVGSAALTAAAIVGSTPAGRPGRVSGSVFHDRSQTGSRRPSDIGLAGILVSNGQDIVATDTEGQWSLPALAHTHVFVIKPRNWTFATQQPACRHFAKLVTADQTSLDFGLIPQRAPAVFDVALLADTQPQTHQELGYLRDGVLKDVADTRAAFAINHGDIVFDDLTLYPRYLQLTGATGMPWHHCPGNHDMNHTDEIHRDPFQVWKADIGPTHYAFEQGDCLFIILNNVERCSDGPRSRSEHNYRGAIGARQLTFVRNVLAQTPRERLIVLSMHIPLVGFEDPTDPAGHTVDRQALLALLAGRPHTVSFAGHTHTTEHHYLGLSSIGSGASPHHHHVLTAASGSWWSGPYDHTGLPLSRSRDGCPRGFHLLSIDGTRYTTRFIPTGEPGQPFARLSLRQSTSHPGDPGASGAGGFVVTQSALAGTELSVNVFDGGPRTQVRMSIGGTAEADMIALTRVEMCDPETVRHFQRHRATLKDWVEACRSSHIWAVPLPASLEPGVHTLNVVLTDEYRRERSVAGILEVVA